MHPSIRTIGTLGLVALWTCGCNTAGQEEWNRMWNNPSWGSKVGSRERESWTIECNAFEGPNHRKMADRMAAMLRKVSQLHSDEVSVSHEERRSRVFYGVYMLRYREAQSERKSNLRGDFVIQLNDPIKRDLKFIRELALGKQHPFFSARPIQKPIPDVGPPQWNLRNATGLYTLNVGVTYPTPTLHNYKEAAVQWVRDLRKHGYKAYYYHNPNKAQSSICVGTFNEQAFFVDAQGRKGYGPAVKALQRKDDFKYNLENGLKVYRRGLNTKTKQYEKIPNWSFLVKIPKREPSPASKGE